jgi:hypothetical protein
MSTLLQNRKFPRRRTRYILKIIRRPRRAETKSFMFRNRLNRLKINFGLKKNRHVVTFPFQYGGQPGDSQRWRDASNIAPNILSIPNHPGRIN